MGNYGQEKWRSPVWRMYPNSNGFKLRPADITETDDVATNPKCQYLARTGTCGLGDAANAITLRLVQPDGCGEDEYYIQSVEDGQYLTMKYDAQSDPDSDMMYGVSTESIGFQVNQSKATLFRFKRYNHRDNQSNPRSSLLNTRIGRSVFLKVNQYRKWFGAVDVVEPEIGWRLELLL